LGHEFDLSGLRDVIGHVTFDTTLGHFLSCPLEPCLCL